ncbi:MAG TPA: ABC transporter ATP-binding protein [Patescibacteria group bacterium]|nr:ABC transporter ATP-binding protein [Patescibacteria group bacterium]
MQDAVDSIITAKDLRIVWGKTAALNGVTFNIAPGKITGLIGPSGSGKTTLMRAIVGAQQLTSGTLTVLGMPAGSKGLRSKLGYVTQSPAVYDDLTTRQNLNYFAAILGLGEKEVERAIKAVDLGRQASQIVGSMSGGQRARVSLAVALLDEPPLLVLDEPTVGLDPVLRQSLWQLFKQLAASGRSLLISSHVMDEAEQCPELLLLRDGSVLSHSSKEGLLERTHTKTVNDAFLALAGGAS